MKLREFAEIRNGNVLIVHCIGRGKGDESLCGGRIQYTDGEYHCDSLVRVAFTPPLPGYKEASGGGFVWNRTSGETLDDLTLAPSINAGECGHYFVRNGEIVPA